ncbi:C3H1-type domain-containing protein [Balamuthia mandrillaris]
MELDIDADEETALELDDEASDDQEEEETELLHQSTTEAEWKEESNADEAKEAEEEDDGGVFFSREAYQRFSVLDAPSSMFTFAVPLEQQPEEEAYQTEEKQAKQKKRPRTKTTDTNSKQQKPKRPPEKAKEEEPAAQQQPQQKQPDQPEKQTTVRKQRLPSVRKSAQTKPTAELTSTSQQPPSHPQQNSTPKERAPTVLAAAMTAAGGSNKPVETEIELEPMPFSSLSREEHVLYLHLHRKFLTQQQQQRAAAAAAATRKEAGDEGTGEGSAVEPPSLLLDGDALAQYYSLRSRVEAEQQQYRAFQYQRIMSSIPARTRFLKYIPALRNHVEQILSHKRDRLRDYPRHFSHCVAVDLSSPAAAVASGDPVLTHSATLLQMGRVLQVHIPASGTPISPNLTCYSLPSTTSSSSPQHSDAAVGAGPFSWTKKGTMPPLSKDPYIRQLVAAHDVDVVLSSSSFVTLIDNHGPGFANSWHIPVSIVASSTTNKSGKRTVYLEKPFLKKKMTLREKNTLFYKLALERSCLSTSPTAAIQFATETALDQGASHATYSSLIEDNLTYNLWNFGPLRVLIRCKIHGHIKEEGGSGYRFVGIQSKLEYFPSQGWEEVTLSETARWWSYTYIRPDAHLLVGHVDVAESRLLLMERKAMTDILPPGCLFRPASSSKKLFLILEKLCNLPPADYLLSHKQADPNVNIYHAMSAEEGGALKEQQEVILDLHMLLASSGATDKESIPYIPTQWKPATGQVPYTFPLPPLHADGPEQAAIRREADGETASGKFSPGGKVRHCYSFARKGTCSTRNCKFPHLTLAQVQEMQAAGGGADPLKKKRNKKKARRPNAPAMATPLPHEAGIGSPSRGKRGGWVDWDTPVDGRDTDDYSRFLASHLQQKQQQQTESSPSAAPPASTLPSSSSANSASDVQKDLLYIMSQQQGG